MQYLVAADLAFNACFTVELILRMLASGGLRAYLMKAWNIFDLFMVLAGYTEFLPASVTGVLQHVQTAAAMLGDLHLAGVARCSKHEDKGQRAAMTCLPQLSCSSARARLGSLPESSPAVHCRLQHKAPSQFHFCAGNNTQSIKALRALRALRPLRTITRFESLRAIVVCFLEASRPVKLSALPLECGRGAPSCCMSERAVLC